MIGVVNGLMTVLLTIIFLGIWAWAWSRKNKKAFDEMANLPLEDSVNSEENHDEQ